MVLIVLVGGVGLFRFFANESPHDPAQARAELEERTPAEIDDSRRVLEGLERSETPDSNQETATPDSLVESGGTEVPEEETQLGSEEPSLANPPPDPGLVPGASSPLLPDDMFDAVMLVGADASGNLADTIILALFPEGGSAPALVSIPRDLYLYNFCSDDYRRVNANLGGCPGYATGSELLALAIEEYTGISVDHYVRVNFDGFVDLVDGLGGVEVCFEYPTRDRNAGLNIPEPACYTDGATALAYARSRNAQQLVDGEWTWAWSSDFSRQRHQREILLKLAGRLQQLSLPELLSSFQRLAHTFRVDGGWSIAEAVEWAWRYRTLDPSQIAQLSIPVREHRTSGGAEVLLPTGTFNDLLSRWWAPAER